MANKRVNDLVDASLPIVGTDKILVSRDGIVLNKANALDLPVSTAVQAAIAVKAELSTAQKANPSITGVAGADVNGGIYDAAGNLVSLGGVPSNTKLTSFANNVYLGNSTCFAAIGDSKTTSDAGTSAYPKRIADLVANIVNSMTNKPAVHYYEFDYASSVPRKLKARQILVAGDPIAQTFRTGVTNKNIPRAALFAIDKSRLAIQLSIKPVSDIPTARGTLVRAVGSVANTFCFTSYIEENTGDLVFIWSTDGTNTVTARATKAQLGTAIQSGVQKDIAIEFIGDNGSSGHTVKFYTSAAFADTWTEIAAAAYTGVGVVSLYALDTTVDSVKIGAESTNFRVLEGEIYDVKVCTHLQGGIQSPPVYEWMPVGNLLSDTNLLGTGTISIFGCGYPGIKSTNMLNNLAMFPKFNRGQVIISTADNEDTYETTLYTQLEQLRTKIEAVYPYTPKAVLIINYNIAPFANAKTQRYRCDYVHSWAVENNLEVINCTGLFARQANFGAAVIKADGQHPTQNNPGSDGQTIVYNEVIKRLGFV